jgi:hypothetical protein
VSLPMLLSRLTPFRLRAHHWLDGLLRFDLRIRRRSVRGGNSDVNYRSKADNNALSLLPKPRHKFAYANAELSRLCRIGVTAQICIHSARGVALVARRAEICRIKSASFRTSGKEIGSSSFLILMAKSQVHTIYLLAQA